MKRPWIIFIVKDNPKLFCYKLNVGNKQPIIHITTPMVLSGFHDCLIGCFYVNLDGIHCEFIVLIFL